MAAISTFRQFEIRCIDGVWMMKFEDVKTLLKDGIARINEGIDILDPDKRADTGPDDVKGGE